MWTACGDASGSKECEPTPVVWLTGMLNMCTTTCYTSFNASLFTTAVVMSGTVIVTTMELVSLPSGPGPLFDPLIRGWSSHDVTL